jgi:pimeloyl-ACP methyl ester carboxylesterase
MNSVQELAEMAKQRKTLTNSTVAGSSTLTANYPATQDPRGKILFIHGIRGTHEGMEAIVGALPDFDCVVVDLPAFGQSKAFVEPVSMTALSRWVRDLVNTHRPTAVLGHSYGSILVNHALASIPVPQILVNPIVSGRKNRSKLFAPRLIAQFYRICGRLPETPGRKLASSNFLVNCMTLALARSRDRQTRQWIFTQHLTHFSEFESLESLIQHSDISTSLSLLSPQKQTSRSMILIAGETDQIAPLRHAKRYCQNQPQLELAVLPKVGHLAHYEAPGQIGQITRQWLANS